MTSPIAGARPSLRKWRAAPASARSFGTAAQSLPTRGAIGKPSRA
jgi:hypothetical protein